MQIGWISNTWLNTEFERLCIYGFMALYKYFIIIIIVIRMSDFQEKSETREVTKLYHKCRVHNWSHFIIKSKSMFNEWDVKGYTDHSL